MASREQRGNREKKKPKKADKDKMTAARPPLSSGGRTQEKFGQLFDKKK